MNELVLHRNMCRLQLIDLGPNKLHFLDLGMYYIPEIVSIQFIHHVHPEHQRQSCAHTFVGLSSKGGGDRRSMRVERLVCSPSPTRHSTSTNITGATHVDVRARWNGQLVAQTRCAPAGAARSDGLRAAAALGQGPWRDARYTCPFVQLLQEYAISAKVLVCIVVMQCLRAPTARQRRSAETGSRSQCGRLVRMMPAEVEEREGGQRWSMGRGGYGGRRRQVRATTRSRQEVKSGREGAEGKAF